MNTFRKHLLKSGSTIREAMQRLDILAKDAIIFIIDDQNKLVGSLTDGDVRRGLLKGIGLENLVDEIIQAHPRYIRKGDYNIDKVIEYRENDFRVIPILDKNNDVVNVINFRELRSYLPVDAVIMAGGRGERLRPLTDTTPKPLLLIGDKPIIEHNINRLALYGIDDFWITVKYLGEQIETYIGDGKTRNLKIHYLYENESMGTIGSVSKIRNFTQDYVLVTNSDLLTNIDYEHFFLDFIKQEADFAVVTIPYHVNIPYAVLETSNGNIMSFKEKPTYTYYSNGGIYLMKRSLIGLIPTDKHYNSTDFLENLISIGYKVVSYPLNGYWLDIGRHEEYERANKDIHQIQF